MPDTSGSRNFDIQPAKANHLCVLVHGLWGNSQHLNYVAQALRDKYDDDHLILLPSKKNASFFTYDGIEIGGERVAREIEQTTQELAKDGYTITRFSIVGYSLGGLFARYAIGLLDQNSYFDKITPVNFTTFASPHLGARTPLLGYTNHLWNVLGAAALSASGRQLFLVDSFRETGKPLFSVLADPDSIFIHALLRFERRTLYANIINDRTAVYYTTGISKTDPYKHMEKIKPRYVKGYEPVVLDPDRPYDVNTEIKTPTLYERLVLRSSTYLRRAPIFLAVAIILPIGLVALLINASIQTVRSRRRILLHEKDGTGEGFGAYRIPLLRKVRAGMEDAFEITNSVQEEEYLPFDSEEMAEESDIRSCTTAAPSCEALASEKADDRMPGTATSPSDRYPGFPVLALTASQFSMIKSLDKIGFRKYGVHIHKSGHSHAAIIVRSSRGAFEEGKLVIKHWLEQEFII